MKSHDTPPDPHTHDEVAPNGPQAPLLECHYHPEIHCLELIVASEALGHPMRVDLWLPRSHGHLELAGCWLVVSHDGQDLAQVHVRDTLDNLQLTGELPPTVVAGVHATLDRDQTLGLDHHPNCDGQGQKAHFYTAFVVDELLPLLVRDWQIGQARETRAIMGFSMGGLSAFSMAFHRPEAFSHVCVVSGSFWWRCEPLGESYNDYDHRLTHKLVRESDPRPLRYWFEAGTHDEDTDQNNNGVIDSIEDTTQLIDELVAKGHQVDRDIHFEPIEYGQHDQKTWAHALPMFLKWWAAAAISGEKVADKVADEASEPMP